jgi:hypothetical protein
MRKIQNVAQIVLALTFMVGIANTQSDQGSAGAQRYQSFGYNSQLKQCASPAACGVGKPTYSSGNGGSDDQRR